MLIRAIRAFIIVIVLLDVAWLAFKYNASFRVLALVVTGHSRWYSLAEASRCYEQYRRCHETARQLAREVRFGEKDPVGFELWHTPKGKFWMPPGDPTVLPDLLAEQEARVYGTGDHGIRSGDVVLDCGAHVGVYTRQALLDGARLVIAVEPAPENLECLRRNLAAEIAARRVIVCAKGVWDREDSMTLKVKSGNSARDSFFAIWEGSRPGPKVPLTAIDNLVSELKLERVDFIKMDIEGAEVRAVKGAASTLSRYKPRLAIASYHCPNDPNDIPVQIRKAWSGYRMARGPCTEQAGQLYPEVLYFR